MLFRFLYNPVHLTKENIKIMVKAKEIYPGSIPPPTDHTGLIVGLVIGGIVLILMVVWLVVR